MSEPPLADFPVAIDLPVQWGDMDAFQHVNNTAFLRWFESSRVAYWDSLGLEHRGGSAFGPILASVTCHYRRQLTYPDAVRVGARVIKIGRSSLTMEHRIVRAASGELAAEGTSVLVAFDYAEGKSRPVPDDVRAAIEAIEGTIPGRGGSTSESGSA